MDRLHPRPTLAVVALLALLAACGPGDQATSDAPEAVPDPAGDPPPTDDPAPADDPATGEATVAVASTSLGDVLVDANGMTLYVFDPDAQGPGTCVDACAASWPPLVEDAPVAGDGVDAGLLGTATHPDGSEQVTYDGWPLYLWAGDGSPGDVTGQGVQDVWWVIAADGTVIRGDDAATGPEPAGSGGSAPGGYDY